MAEELRDMVRIITVRTHQYQASHGRKPRGTGLWAFLLHGVEFCFTGTYSQAKAQAVAAAKRLQVHTIDVLP